MKTVSNRTLQIVGLVLFFALAGCEDAMSELDVPAGKNIPQKAGDTNGGEGDDDPQPPCSGCDG